MDHRQGTAWAECLYTQCLGFSVSCTPSQAEREARVPSGQHKRQRTCCRTLLRTALALLPMTGSARNSHDALCHHKNVFVQSQPTGPVCRDLLLFFCFLPSFAPATGGNAGSLHDPELLKRYVVVLRAQFRNMFEEVVFWRHRQPWPARAHNPRLPGIPLPLSFEKRPWRCAYDPKEQRLT